MLSAQHSHQLALLGAGPDTLAQLADLPGPVGRVVRTERAHAVVQTATATVTARTGSALPCAVGDWVALCEDPAAPAATGGSPPEVVARLPRRGEIRRRTAGATATAQVLAANVDHVAVVVALSQRLSTQRTERFLAVSWDSGATPVLVLTKADLVSAQAREHARAEAASVAPGVDVLLLSSRTGEGLAPLRALLGPGRSMALLGSSGAGKSSLLNAVVGHEAVRVGEVSHAGGGKGRHTTTWRELVVADGGGALIDTPGLRGLGMWLEGDGLQTAFSDIAELAVDCRFRDCAHTGEPGCAVLEGIDAGLLDARRLESARTLEREAAWLARRVDARARSQERKLWAARTREGRRRARP